MSKKFKPFYYVSPFKSVGEESRNAPTGWYAEVDDGLVFLGESILDRVPATKEEEKEP